MDIKLQNIGIIKNSTIKLDGLTVITGQNNSGKTTVGKVVYSLLDAVSNLQKKAKNDKINYIEKQLELVKSTLESLHFIRYAVNKIPDALFAENPIIKALFSRKYRVQSSGTDLEQFARELFGELQSFDINDLKENKELSRYYEAFISNKKNLNSLFDIFNEQRKKALTILEKLFDDISKDSELIDYAMESVNQTLNIEFANQIQPVRNAVKESKIELTENDSIYFSFKIVDNKIVNNGKPIFISSPYEKTYFIDDPFILDEHPSGRFRDQEVENSESFLNTERILTHANRLKFALRSGQRPTIFEKTILDKSLSGIKEQMDQVLPGKFEFSSDGEYYIQNGSKLKITNLATGSKMFSILKILLEKGEINNTTMLILDEPEAHLHPSWQNKFAEIIVLLVKELNTNILLTTHSPNFMLAIDAYMRKYDIISKTNFYQTECLDDGFVEYNCVNDDMGIIYSDFVQYLSEVKMLRNKYNENQDDMP